MNTGEFSYHATHPVTTAVGDVYPETTVVAVRLGEGAYANDGATFFMYRAEDCDTIAAAFADAACKLREFAAATESAEQERRAS